MRKRVETGENSTLEMARRARAAEVEAMRKQQGGDISLEDPIEGEEAVEAEESQEPDEWIPTHYGVQESGDIVELMHRANGGYWVMWPSGQFQFLRTPRANATFTAILTPAEKLLRSGKREFCREELTLMMECMGRNTDRASGYIGGRHVSVRYMGDGKVHYQTDHLDGDGARRRNFIVTVPAKVTLPTVEDL